jgi:hypothetical protein
VGSPGSTRGVPSSCQAAHGLAWDFEPLSGVGAILCCEGVMRQLARPIVSSLEEATKPSFLPQLTDPHVVEAGRDTVKVGTPDV